MLSIDYRLTYNQIFLINLYYIELVGLIKIKAILFTTLQR